MTTAASQMPKADGGFRGPISWYRDPWRKPRVLQLATWGYLLWSLLPVVIAILVSFTKGRSNASFICCSLKWWTGGDDLGLPPPGSLFHGEALRIALIHTVRLSVISMFIAVPLGVAFAIGIDRWRGRAAGAANFTMLVSFVVPELIIGVSMLLAFTTLLKFIPLGTVAQVIGLVAYQVSYPVIVLRARLLSLNPSYEEAALDLGATPRSSLRRVLLPMLYPAIFASFALVFADVVDDFVTVRYLAGLSNTETLSVKIYGAVRATPTPAYNAAATFMLLATVSFMAVGFLLYKRFGRGQDASATAFAGSL